MTTLKIQDILGLRFGIKADFQRKTENTLLFQIDVVSIENRTKFKKCLEMGSTPEMNNQMNSSLLRAKNLSGITFEYLHFEKKNEHAPSKRSKPHLTWALNSKCYILEINGKGNNHPAFLAFYPHTTSQSMRKALTLLKTAG